MPQATDEQYEQWRDTARRLHASLATDLADLASLMTDVTEALFEYPSERTGDGTFRQLAYGLGHLVEAHVALREACGSLGMIERELVVVPGDEE